MISIMKAFNSSAVEEGVGGGRFKKGAVVGCSLQQLWVKASKSADN